MPVYHQKEQAEKELSIPAQLEGIRNFCEQKGWTLIHEYIDAGKSAKTDERPEFQNMIAKAKSPKRDFNAIIVHKYDRFSRNRDDHVVYKSLLKKIGVTVYSVTEQTDPETPHGFLLEGIMEVISEFYNMNLKAESMKGLNENAKRGFHNGGRAPYRYRLSRVDGKTSYILGPDIDVETAKLLAEPLDLNAINSTNSAKSDAQFVGKYYRVTGIIDQAMEPSDGQNAMVIIEPDVMAKGMGSTLPLEINIWLNADEFEKIGGISSVGKQIDVSVKLTSISRNTISKDSAVKGYPIQLEFGEAS